MLQVAAKMELLRQIQKLVAVLTGMTFSIISLTAVLSLITISTIKNKSLISRPLGAEIVIRRIRVGLNTERDEDLRLTRIGEIINYSCTPKIKMEWLTAMKYTVKMSQMILKMKWKRKLLWSMLTRDRDSIKLALVDLEPVRGESAARMTPLNAPRRS